MTKYYCDICGKEIPHTCMSVAVYYAANTKNEYECCKNCLVEIRNLIDERQKASGVYKK